jgi:hypothetical protein
MDLLMFGRTRSAATAHLLEELSGTVRVTRDAPRATPGFFEYLTGNGRVQERRRVKEERPRIRAQHLYTLPDGHLFVVGSPDLLELVNARTALWPRYAAKVVPRDFDYCELRFALPSQRVEPEGRPSRAANARSSEASRRASSAPEDGAACPACSSLNPAGAPECEVCGEPLR